MLKVISLFLIRFYQKVLSPDQGFFRFLAGGPVCRFYPSCSEYCFRSIEKHGFAKGVFRGAKRILRCHPWSRGGKDLP